MGLAALAHVMVLALRHSRTSWFWPWGTHAYCDSGRFGGRVLSFALRLGLAGRCRWWLGVPLAVEGWGLCVVGGLCGLARWGDAG